MSINLSIMIPNDCKWDENHDGRVAYLQKTIKQIEEYFCSTSVVDEIIIDKEHEEYSFTILPLDVEVNLENGYWRIENFFRYSLYFMRDEEGVFGLRDSVFDVLRAFGREDGWVCDEYHSWNGVMDDHSKDFNFWLGYDNKEGANQPSEFIEEHFQGTWTCQDDYECKYFDRFSSSKKKLAEYSAIFSDYRILTVGGLGMFILGVKDNKVFILDPAKRQPLINESIDGCERNLNAAGIVLIKGKRKALFANTGKQLTDFREGDFEWRWADRGSRCSDYPPQREIIDMTTGQTWIEPE